MIAAVLLATPGVLVAIAALVTAVISPNELKSTELDLILMMIILPTIGVISAIGIWLRRTGSWYSSELYCAWFAYCQVVVWVLYGKLLAPANIAFMLLHLAIMAYFLCPRPRAYFGISLKGGLMALPLIGISAALIYHAIRVVPVLLLTK